MSALLAVSRAIDAVNDRIGVLAAWLVFLAVLVSAGNAFLRYSFSIGSNAWLELQWYMFSAIFLLGAAHTLRKNEHVRVDIIYSLVGDRGRLFIDILGFLIFFFPMTILIFWLSVPDAVKSFVQGETSMNAGGLIRWPVRLLLPLGFLLLILQGVSELIKRIATLKGALQIDTHYEKPLQ